MSDELSGLNTGPLHPDTCPCCGAVLVRDENLKLKYREFSYSCGAEGYYHERYAQNPCNLDMDVYYVASSIEWTIACSKAMDHFMSMRRSERQLA